MTEGSLKGRQHWRGKPDVFKIFQTITAKEKVEYDLQSQILHGLWNTGKRYEGSCKHLWTVDSETLRFDGMEGQIPLYKYQVDASRGF